MATTEMANVRYARPELLNELSKWKMVRDCLAGEKAIKAAKDVYLPRPNPEDVSPENKLRYESYLQRAVFYNATRRTLDGLVGQVFIRDPIFEAPVGLEYLLKDTNGAGIALHEHSKAVLGDTVSFGRVGLLVDFPTLDRSLTKADQDSGYYRPTIKRYEPEDIINWRTTQVGSRRLLSLVVLQELYAAKDDGFQQVYEIQWRVLRLMPFADQSESNINSPDIPHYYQVDIWRQQAATSTNTPEVMILSHSYTPRDAEGNSLEEIPFVIIGAINNDPELDPSPLYDLAILNIHHYCNSADYEESCFFVGQPTVWCNGLTESWVKDVLHGVVTIGSRAAVLLPIGAQAGMLQVTANTLPSEAMDKKEKQMVALGARLVEQRNVQQTLGEAQQKEAAQTSILASVAKNVGSAYTRALEWCLLFTGLSGPVKYELNTDFIAAQMTPEERAQLVAEWIDGAISRTEMRNRLRKAGVATQDDTTAVSEIEKDDLRLSTILAKKGPGPSELGSKENPNTGGASPLSNSKTQR